MEWTGQAIFSECSPTLESFQATVDGMDSTVLWRDYVRPDFTRTDLDGLFMINSANYSGKLSYVPNK